jgi:hypothetical protein
VGSYESQPVARQGIEHECDERRYLYGFSLTHIYSLVVKVESAMTLGDRGAGLSQHIKIPKIVGTATLLLVAAYIYFHVISYQVEIY